jgi:putative RNA 2'-phosphotransferase
MSSRLVTVSKFISKHLRHEPEKLGLLLEPGGWVLVDDLLDGAAEIGFTISRDELERVVAESDKQRFSFDESGEKIRANQGHSTAVDLQLPDTPPPAVLYHGTPEKFVAVILAEGLKKMKRHDVHLSPDVATAVKVGSRRGKPVILAVDSARMAADGHTFRVSANGVWLTDHVPAKYLSRAP